MAKTYDVKFKWSLARLTWINVFSNVSDSAEEAIAAFTVNPLLVALRSAMSTSVGCFQISASRIPIVGDDVFVRENSRRNPGIVPDATERLPDVTQTVARLEVNGNGHNRVVSISGLVDSRVTRDAAGNDIPTANLDESFSAIVAALRGGGWRIKHNVPFSTPGYAPIQVTKIEAQIDTNFQNSVITTNGNHGFVAGDRIVFSNSNDPDLVQYQNAQRVMAVTATTFIVNSRYRFPLDDLFPVNFFVRKFGQAVSAITNGEFQDFSGRQRGNSAGRKRGATRRLSARR